MFAVYFSILIPLRVKNSHSLNIYRNNLSTFVTHFIPHVMLADLITSKTRLRLLVKFFTNVANDGYLRGLAIEMNESTNSIRKELNNLSEAGIILRRGDEHKITYQANSQHPFYHLLQQIVRKHVGIDTIVASILERTGDVERVWITGSYARGIASNVIEVVVEGPNINQDYLEQLAPKIEAEIQKKIKFTTTFAYQGDGFVVFEKE